MDYNKSHQLCWACILGGGAIMMLGSSAIDTNETAGIVVTVIGLAVILGGIIQDCIFCKCPRCGSHLNTRGGMPKYCPECGHRLDG